MMNRRSKLGLSGLAVLSGALLSSPSTAYGQVWLQDRTLAEGRGIRAGNFELHPGIGAEFGYDSNVFYSPVNPVSALRLRVTPSLMVSTLGQQRSTNSDSTPTALPTVNFRGGVALTYHEWIATSDPDRVSALRNLGTQASVRFDFFPQRTWQFSLYDEFTRTIQPGPEANAALSTSIAPPTFNRNYNRAGVDIAYAPGRGTFEFRFGYALNVNIFDSSDFSRYDYMTHEVNARLRYRFLPKTALVWEAQVRPTSYLSPETSVTGLFSSTPIGGRVGLLGLITEKVQVMALVGYQATFFERGDNADTIVGQAELRWIINAASNLRGGFHRDVQPSFFGNFAVRNRGYLAYQQSFNGRVLLSLDGSVGYFEYGYVANRDGTRSTSGSGFDPTSGRFSTVRVEGTAFLEYRPSDVFGINISARGGTNISEARLGLMNGLDGRPGQPVSWTRLESFLGVRLNW